MAAFLLVFDNLMPALTADYRKNHLTFQIFHYSCFSTAATKCSCYQDSSVIQLVCLFGFSVEESDATGFNESEC